MDARQFKVKALREADIARLTKGDDLEELQPRLVLATLVARPGTGFELTFAVMTSSGPTYAGLRFDRAGKLMDWKLEKASPLP
jgi:hypothetical protein